MGKRKIGEIYNKPIVEGDINLKTPNEIHKSELVQGGGEGGKEDVLYLTINASIETAGTSEVIPFLLMDIPTLIKFKVSDYSGIAIAHWPLFEQYVHDHDVYIYGIRIDKSLKTQLNPDSRVLTTVGEYLNMISQHPEYTALKKMTEEEFYNLNL